MWMLLRGIWKKNMASTNENLRRKVWRCSNRYKVKKEKGCPNKHSDEKILYQTFINTFNAIIENEEHFIEKWKVESEDGNELRKYKAREFIQIIEDREVIEEFDIDLYFKMIEKITAFGNEVIVRLLDGTEVECIIE